mmetsp:Transcript_1306/g.2313  ORF Transcript_1306/g.2313 Transcript_1306/m.2313 type:complete len:208 (-) Transcript_1306:13-636(-)
MTRRKGARGDGPGPSRTHSTQPGGRLLPVRPRPALRQHLLGVARVRLHVGGLDAQVLHLDGQALLLQPPPLPRLGVLVQPLECAVPGLRGGRREAGGAARAGLERAGLHPLGLQQLALLFPVPLPLLELDGVQPVAHVVATAAVPVGILRGVGDRRPERARLRPLLLLRHLLPLGVLRHPLLLDLQPHRRVVELAPDRLLRRLREDR